MYDKYLILMLANKEIKWKEKPFVNGLHNICRTKSYVDLRNEANAWDYIAK